MERHCGFSGFQKDVRVILRHRLHTRHGTVLDQLLNILHRFDGIRIIIAGSLLIIGNDLAAHVIHDIVICLLVVIVPDGDSVLASVLFGQLLRIFHYSIPCPCLVRICHAGLIKHGLVVPQRDRVNVLRDAVNFAVICIQFFDFFRIF